MHAVLYVLAAIGGLCVLSLLAFVGYVLLSRDERPTYSGPRYQIKPYDPRRGK